MKHKVTLFIPMVMFALAVFLLQSSNSESANYSLDYLSVALLNPTGETAPIIIIPPF